MKMKSIIVLIMVLAILAASVAAEELTLSQIKSAMDRLDMEQMKTSQEKLESGLQGDKTYSMLAVIYNFYSDFYSYIDEDQRKARDYTDQTITAALKALESDESVLLYSVLADAYSKKLTGPLSAIRFGRRVSDALEQAEFMDTGSEELLYVKAKRYLLAPALFGGNREQAIDSFERLIERNPNSSIYHAFLGESYKTSDQEKAQRMFARAVELSINNTWAKRELEK